MIFRLVLLTIIFIADRLVKNFFWLKSPDFNEGGFLFVAHNQDIAFSLNIPELILYPLIAILLVVVAWQALLLFNRKDEIFFLWGLVFIGAVSNIIDRVRWGAVLDYINLGWWPVFNLSDSLIVIGVVLIIWHELNPASSRKLRKLDKLD